MAPESSKMDGDRVELLDDEGEMVPKFEDALAYIFQKYCVTASSMPASESEDKSSGSSTSIQQPKLGSRPAQDAVLSDLALDKFAHDTNGSPFSEDTKEELRTFLDCDDEGRLTVSTARSTALIEKRSSSEEDDLPIVLWLPADV